MAQLGLDIGGASIKAAVLRGGRCVRVAQSRLYQRPTIQVLQAALGEVAQGVAVDRVGLCVPGTWDASRRVLTQCVNIPALVGVPLERCVREALGLRGRLGLRVCSDAVAAAQDIGRARRLHGRLLVLALGTGVGCGVVDGREALHVDGESPGHLGQMDVSIAGEEVIGPDGGAGGLEGYIGAPALWRRHGGINPVEAVGGYKGDEPPVLALVRALRIAHAIYRPQHICLCGGIGLALRRLVPVIRKRVADRLTSLARPGWTLTCGDDLFHSARGAAWLAGRATL
jgi:predicted NBD/HSP70 family sugar kinase